MNKNLKRGLVLAASVAAAASLTLAAPATAHDRGASNGSYEYLKRSSHATVSATVTSIPSTITDGRLAHRGAYFTIYKLSSTETTLPATQPTSGGIRMGVHPASLGTAPTVSNGTLTGVLKFRGEVSTTVRYAVYPSSGGDAVLVTVVTDANGVATATTSASLTVSYSQSVADAALVKAEGMGKSHRGGHKGPRR